MGNTVWPYVWVGRCHPCNLYWDVSSHALAMWMANEHMRNYHFHEHSGARAVVRKLRPPFEGEYDDGS